MPMLVGLDLATITNNGENSCKILLLRHDWEAGDLVYNVNNAKAIAI